MTDRTELYSERQRLIFSIVFMWLMISPAHSWKERGLPEKGVRERESILHTHSRWDKQHTRTPHWPYHQPGLSVCFFKTCKCSCFCKYKQVVRQKREQCEAHLTSILISPGYSDEKSKRTSAHTSLSGGGMGEGSGWWERDGGRGGGRGLEFPRVRVSTSLKGTRRVVSTPGKLVPRELFW